MSDAEEFVPVEEPVKKRKPRKRSARKSKKNGKNQLRLSELEMAHMDLTERDHQLAITNLELVRAKLTNLTMDFHRKQSILKQQIEDAKVKVEQVALIKNKRMAEVDQRLRDINPDFSFSTYIIKDDGELIPESEVIGSKEETAEDLSSV